MFETKDEDEVYTDENFFNDWVEAQEIKRREETINTIKNSWLGYNAEYDKKVKESK